MGKLTESMIRDLEPREKVYSVWDGEGLYLEVAPNGAKRWRTQYSMGGKKRVAAHGVWPKVSLKEARTRHDAARRLIAQGIDPVETRRAARRGGGTGEGGHTFAQVAGEWQRLKGKGWSPAHANTIAFLVNRHLAPNLGPRPIADITAQDVLALARRIENAGRTDTARRIVALAVQIFNHGIVTGACELNPAAAIGAALAPAPKAKSMGYTTEPARLAAFLKACAEYDGAAATRAALILAPYLLLRPGELRKLEWPQVDFERGELRLPVEAMKRGRLEKDAHRGEVAHIVPLARQTLALFREWYGAQRGSGKGYVFAVKQDGPPISNATMSAALRRMGDVADGLTIHGLRHTASTILHEAGHPSHVIEKQLSHLDANRIRGIYNHAEYLPERRAMLQAWADYLDNIKAGRGVVLSTAPASGELDAPAEPLPEPMTMADQILGNDRAARDAALPENLRRYLEERRGRTATGGAEHHEEGGDNAADMG